MPYLNCGRQVGVYPVVWSIYTRWNTEMTRSSIHRFHKVSNFLVPGEHRFLVTHLVLSGFERLAAHGRTMKGRLRNELKEHSVTWWNNWIIKQGECIGLFNDSFYISFPTCQFVSCLSGGIVWICCWQPSSRFALLETEMITIIHVSHVVDDSSSRWWAVFYFFHAFRDHI